MFIQYFLNYWWNRTFTIFWNIYNFSIFKIWKRKTVWAERIFDGFSTSRFFLFLSFYEWAIFSRSWLKSASCSNAGFIQTEDSPSDFSNACRPLWREDSVDQSFDFSSSTTSPNHTIRLILTYFVSTGKIAKGKVRLPFFSPTTSKIGPCYPIFQTKMGCLKIDATN